MKVWTIMLAVAFTSSLATAQPVDVNHLTGAQISAKYEELKARAKAGDGSAGVKLTESSNYFTMLTYRMKSAGGELHEHYTDVFLVVRGDATLITGGSLVTPSPAGAGEIRGSAIAGGTETHLHQGDIVQIPAHVPHQLQLEPGHEFLYYVLKIHE